MSQYVYAVDGDFNFTVLTGFNCTHQRFFADVFVGEDTAGDPIHSLDAVCEREMAAMLEEKGIPMHGDALSQLSQDHIESIFCLSDIGRRFGVFSTLTI